MVLRHRSCETETRWLEACMNNALVDGRRSGSRVLYTGIAALMLALPAGAALWAVGGQFSIIVLLGLVSGASALASP